MRKIDFTVTDEYDSRPVQSVLKNALFLSGTLIKKLKMQNGILKNGTPVFVNERVHTGDVVTAVIDNNNDTDKKCPFEILYEDSDLIIINKPAKTAVHATKQIYGEYTIASGIREYLGGEFHPLNRLDRGTSGVMVIAKSGYMHTRLSGMLHTENFSRTYLAIVCGRTEKSGIIDIPIGRDSISPILRVADINGKPAITHYSAEKYTDKYTLVKVMPKTGRTHQIRLHFSSIGHPLAGDFLYGREDKQLIDRFALHSYQVDFIHPITHEHICVTSPLPADMQSIIADK